MDFLYVLVGLILEFVFGFLMSVSIERLDEGIWFLLLLISIGAILYIAALLGALAGWLVFLGLLAGVAGNVVNDIR